MRFLRPAALAVLALMPALLAAQQPDSTPVRIRRDSLAKAARDSIELMKSLGADLAPSTSPATGAQPANQRLLPDISVVGDFLVDASPKGSTQEDGTRFGVREVEVAFQAVVDPYLRGDVFLGVSDLEGIAIEQAYLTATALPYQLEGRLGRFLMPFGKQTTTHRHDLHTIEYPYVIQRLFGPEGIKGTGVYASRVFAPLGFYQELQLTAVDRLSEAPDGLVASEPANKSLGGLGYSARVRNYVDISEAANMEMSFSGMTGKREQPVSDDLTALLVARGSDVNAVNARQSTFGADVTFRWRPLQQALYKSFILQGEIMHQRNERSPFTPDAGLTCGTRCSAEYAGPARDFTGGYVYARTQVTQRGYLGARADQVQDPAADGRTLRAGSVYLEWFPSEFSKLVAGYEGVKSQGSAVVNRLLLQATFALGPHKPHPF